MLHWASKDLPALHLLSYSLIVKIDAFYVVLLRFWVTPALHFLLSQATRSCFKCLLTREKESSRCVRRFSKRWVSGLLNLQPLWTCVCVIMYWIWNIYIKEAPCVFQIKCIIVGLPNKAQRQRCWRGYRRLFKRSSEHVLFVNIKLEKRSFPFQD